MGGNKKLKFLREAACSLLAFILCLRQTVHKKVISPMLLLLCLEKTSLEKVRMNVVIRYFGKGF